MLEINYKTPLRLIDDINDSSLETKFINFSAILTFLKFLLRAKNIKIPSYCFLIG